MFIFIVEFFVNSEKFENQDRSIIISMNKTNHSTFFIISKLNEYLNMNQLFNSHIVNLNIKLKTKENIRIIFQHLVNMIIDCFAFIFQFKIESIE